MSDDQRGRLSPVVLMDVSDLTEDEEGAALEAIVWAMLGDCRDW